MHDIVYMYFYRHSMPILRPVLTTILSSLTCYYAFYCLGVSQPTVNLTSTLHKGDVAIDGQQVNFTCITTSTDDILTWRSAHYIEGILQVSFHDAPGSTDSNQQNPNTVATLVSATTNGGVIVIESHLWIRASMQYPNCSAACQINSHGPMSIIAFQTLPGEEMLATVCIKFDSEINIHAGYGHYFKFVHLWSM